MEDYKLELAAAKGMALAYLAVGPLNDERVQSVVDFVCRGTEKISKLSETDLDHFRSFIRSYVEEIVGRTQEEGSLLLDDYEKKDWYDSSKPRPYWEEYLEYLKTDTNWVDRQYAVLDSDTDKICGALGDPTFNGSFHVKGLVVGDVQSGKTSTYIGLMCKAADAGYKVFVLLTGTTEKLRSQTQKRVEKGFIGIGQQEGKEENGLVGVGLSRNKKGILFPISLTSASQDFVMKASQNSSQMVGDQPLVFVCKKQVSILKRIYSALSVRKGPNGTVNSSLLLIDDESDNASVNTSKDENDPTKVNLGIRNLLELFARSSYVGITATPFANVFIDPDSVDSMCHEDLFPKDFIFTLNPPSNYLGASKYFDKESKYYGCLRLLDELDIGPTSCLPIDHKQDWESESLPEKLYEAIRTYCLADCICQKRGFPKKRSMLINVSYFSSVHRVVKRDVDGYIERLRKALRFFSDSENETNNDITELKATFETEYSKCGFSWEELLPILYDSVLKIETFTVNSKAKMSKEKEKAFDAATSKIVIGGYSLSRGLTLDGLIVSYMSRSTSTYDVLMQMGRWFGYRPHFEDLIRIWLPKDTAGWYGDISTATEELKSDIAKMNELKMRPREFGVRIRNMTDELDITSPEKMRTARLMGCNETLFGKFKEAAAVPFDSKANNDNLLAAKKLAVNAGAHGPLEGGAYVFKDVPRETVEQFFREYRFDYMEDAKAYFDTWSSIRSFIFDVCSKMYSKWDVAFASNVKQDDESGAPFPVTDEMSIIPMSRKVKLYDGPMRIVISGTHAHIGSSTDTSYGLSKEKINYLKMNRVSEKCGSDDRKLYLCEGRNPLLVIYICVARPLPEFSQGTQNAARNSLEIMVKMKKPLLAFAVGFPRSSECHIETKVYYTNRRAVYSGGGDSNE